MPLYRKPSESLPRALYRRLYGLLRAYDTEWWEGANALFFLGLGAWLILPFKTFYQAGILIPSWSSFQATGGEWLWGPVFAAFGLLCLYALITDSRVARGRCAYWSAVLWGTTGLMFLIGAYVAVGFILYQTHALFSLLTYLRLRGKL